MLRGLSSSGSVPDPGGRQDRAPNSVQDVALDLRPKERCPGVFRVGLAMFPREGLRLMLWDNTAKPNSENFLETNSETFRKVMASLNRVVIVTRSVSETKRAKYPSLLENPCSVDA